MQRLPKLLTPKQAAELLEIPEATLATWRCRKLRDLRFVRIGRMVRYELAEIERFITINRAI